MSGQVSRGSPTEYQADEQAGVAWLSCRGSVTDKAPESRGWGGVELLLIRQKRIANVVVPELRMPEGS